MSIGRPFKFLHASDFRLHLPLTGLGEIPAAWRQSLAQAPQQAAARVFDAALAHEADFVVLSGGLLDWRQTAVSDFLFLRGQLQRLAERNIAVYWAGGHDDSPEDRPAEFALPEGTVVFSRGQAQEHTIHIDGEPRARVLGVSREHGQALVAGVFPEHRSRLFTVAAAHNAGERIPLEMPGVHYWALGGEQVAEECALVNGAVVRYSGSPLCRGYDEEGAHGCTIVSVDEQNQILTRHVETDDTTWSRQSIVVRADEPVSQWEERLLAGAARLAQLPGRSRVLVRFTIEGPVDEIRRARGAGHAKRWLKRLRGDFGQSPSALWTEQVELRARVETSRDAHAKDSLVGEYLDVVRRLEQSPQEAIDLETYRHEHSGHVPEDVAALQDPQARRQALAQSAALGVEALLGQEAQA